MRGKKSYNIRNIEAHLNRFRQPEQQLNQYQESFANSVGRDLIFKTNNSTVSSININQNVEQQRQNEYINAKFGVSKYASNLVSGRMFKNI